MRGSEIRVILSYILYCSLACSVAQRLSYLPDDTSTSEKSAPITVQLWLYHGSMSISEISLLSFHYNFMLSCCSSCLLQGSRVYHNRCCTADSLSDWLHYMPDCTVHSWNVDSTLPSHHASSPWDWLGGDQGDLRQCGVTKQSLATKLRTQPHALRVSV